ncbi:MAG TPA: ABC transporter permease [Tepidisphaeraceae bacterium]|jgi:putative ABC transport system permease protein
MLRLASLILRNVLRNRRRTLLTLASVAVSLAILGFLAALYQGFFFAEQTSPSEALRLITRNKVSLARPLVASQQAKIASVDGVVAVSTWSWFAGKYKDDRPENFFARFAVDPEQIRRVRVDYVAPDEQWTAFQRNRTACAMARKIADQHGFKLGDIIHIKGDIYPVDLELKVEMIYDHPANTECMMFQREYLRELLNATGSSNTDTVGTYSILARSADDVPRIAREIDSMFENSSWATKTQSEHDFALSFMAFMGNIKLYLAVVCAAVTFTILLVSANTIAMSVRERTREMAILRTLGYSPGDIMQVVLGESVLLALIGGLVGIGVTYGLTHAAAAGAGPWGEMMKFRWQASLIVAAFAVVIGLVSALIPAHFASRRNIVESLRFTG